MGGGAAGRRGNKLPPPPAAAFVYRCRVLESTNTHAYLDHGLYYVPWLWRSSSFLSERSSKFNMYIITWDVSLRTGMSITLQRKSDSIWWGEEKKGSEWRRKKMRMCYVEMKGRKSKSSLKNRPISVAQRTANAHTDTHRHRPRRI